MKKILVIFSLIYLFSFNIYSQDEDKEKEVSFDLLRSPNSPAFQLLEIDEEKIERPTTPMDFEVKIKDATNNFSTLPKNYSIEIAPFWLFGGQNYSFTDFISSSNNFNNIIFNNIPQTFIFSLATTTKKDTITSVEARKFALGLKFSFLRGHLSTDDYMKLNIIKQKLDGLNQKYKLESEELYKNDSIHQFLEKEIIPTRDSLSKLQELLEKISDPNSTEAKILKLQIESIESKFDKILELKSQRENELDTTKVRPLLKTEENELIEFAEDLKFKRYGFKIDLAGGLSLDFPTNDFDYSVLNTAAGWLTFGYDWECDASLFFVGRCNVKYYKDSTGKNNYPVNLDYGFKGILDKYKKFSISSEFVWKSYIKKVDGETKIRFTVNLSYEIFKNKLITFNIGKEFDKKVETGGNLIAALNLILGFGSDRNIR